VLLVVNARSSPRTDWDRQESSPGIMDQLLQASGVPIERYSFETIETMKDRAEIWKWRRDLLVAQARLAGATEAAAESNVPKFDLHVLDVSFDAISDPKERAYFMDLPTSFVLPAEAVDRLREIACRLLHQSPEYKRVVQELGGSSVE
jgi:NTE family protein